MGIVLIGWLSYLLQIGHRKDKVRRRIKG
ncbi:hypothetical protein M0L20_26430 [Spirosoma sp. RP8]|uniref:CcmD family protein n=1 Tax=Spirosoma liriopis TaxID=2937440 RepID=A0ABT0HTW8_9BACT|nr:hypothetical protein [Spirosoma oryzicola]MCK8495430.1 hypothetical protein [Spirosoma liriopis]UHG94471.1 hypothetical protein LQ777_27480 [Spirosoma oryzicola]